MKWLCAGGVRGGCGVLHRSREAAKLHCAKDHRACEALGGGAYSDRAVIPADDEAFEVVERERNGEGQR